MEGIENIVTSITELLVTGGPLFGILFILLESVLPMLPLGVFIALNVEAYGKLFGFLLSWGATCLGCFFSFFVFSRFVNAFMNRYLKKQKKVLQKLEKKVNLFPFSHLVLVIALPFTPAFLINIACGLSKMPFRKFMMAIFLGKLSIVFFWGFVGTSLIESITDIKTIILISLLLVVSYVLSKFVSRKLKID